MDDNQSLKEGQADGSADRGQPAEYGQRVDVLPGGIETQIGTYDCATVDGDIFTGTLVEIQNTTSMTGVSALSYRLDKSEIKGKFPKPTTWSMLSALSFSLLIAVLIFDLALGIIDLGASRWSYILPLALIAIISTMAIGKRMRTFVVLAITGIELEKIGKKYKKPMLDLPVGRVKEARDSVNQAVTALPKLKQKKA